MSESVVIEGKNSFFMGAQAHILDTSIDKAWAEKFVKHNPAMKWILGKFVEADNPNQNKQFFTMADLEMSQPTIDHAPLNMLHNPRSIVGSFVATDMVFPLDAAAESGIFNPYIEALAAFWSFYFPKELAAIEAADAAGSLFFSMETIAKNIICEGENGCMESFPYVGADSATYCEHLQAHVSVRHLENPHFLAGALIVPPTRPGWNNAEARSISELVKEHQVEAEAAYEMAEQAAPYLDARQWEFVMGELLLKAYTESAKA